MEKEGKGIGEDMDKGVRAGRSMDEERRKRKEKGEGEDKVKGKRKVRKCF